MTSFLDKMNLKPQERRWVVIVVLVVFVLLNFLFVWPNFGSLSRSEQGLRDTKALLKKYNDEISRQSLYARQLRELQEGGQFIANEEQGLRLSQEVNNQAALTGVGAAVVGLLAAALWNPVLTTSIEDAWDVAFGLGLLVLLRLLPVWAVVPIAAAAGALAF